MVQLPDWTAIGAGAPQPAYRRVQPDNAGREIEQGTEALGAGIVKSAQDYAEAQQQQHVQSVNLARAQASNALLDHEIAVKTQAEQINQGVADGSVPYTQARQTYDDAVAKIPAPTVPNLDEIGQVNLTKGLQRNVFTAGLGVDNAVVTARRNDFKDQFSQNLDKLGILAGMPDADIQSINDKADAFAPLARQAGVPQTLIDESLTKFKEQNWLNDATQRAMEAKEDPGALRDLEEDLTDKDGFYAGRLNTERRNSVLRSVINDQLILENRAEHLQDKREARGQQALNQINEQISSGIPATPMMWNNWQTLTKGTNAEEEFKQAQDDETTVQKVLRQPIDQQQAFVQQKVSQLETSGGTLRDRANLMRLQTAVNQNVNLMEKAPLLFSAQRNGMDVQPLELDKAGTADGQQALSVRITDRMNTLSALRKQYGPQIGLTPLLPNEAAALTSQLDQSTPQDRYTLLTSLRNGFQNDDAYQAAMKQIAPHSPVTAIVGQRVGQSIPAATPVWFNRDYTLGRDDAQTVLNGESLLNPDKGQKAGTEAGKAGFNSVFPMPTVASSGQTLQQIFGQKAAGLFPDRPQLAQDHFEMFRAAYAGLLAKSGNMKGTADPKLEQQALDIALGKSTQRIDFNGSTLRAPDGMDPSIFQSAVQQSVAAAAKSAGAPADWQQRIRGYQLREVGGYGSGQFQLINGNQPLIRPDGKGYLMIDLKNQYLPRTAPAAAGP